VGGSCHSPRGTVWPVFSPIRVCVPVTVPAMRGQPLFPRCSRNDRHTGFGAELPGPVLPIGSVRSPSHRSLSSERRIRLRGDGSEPRPPIVGTWRVRRPRTVGHVRGATTPAPTAANSRCASRSPHRRYLRPPQHPVSLLRACAPPGNPLRCVSRRTAALCLLGLRRTPECWPLA